MEVRCYNNIVISNILFRGMLMKKILALFIAAVCILVSACGCAFADEKVADKTFSKAGMSITLTDEFVEKDRVSYAACYDSQNVAIFVIKEEFSIVEDLKDYAVEEYANLVIQNNGLENCEVVNDDGLIYFIHDYVSNGKNYKYFDVVLKSNDAFWMFQFSCENDNFDALRPNFVKWVKSVSFDK